MRETKNVTRNHRYFDFENVFDNLRRIFDTKQQQQQYKNYVLPRDYLIAENYCNCCNFLFNSSNSMNNHYDNVVKKLLKKCFLNPKGSNHSNHFQRFQRATTRKQLHFYLFKYNFNRIKRTNQFMNQQDNCLISALFCAIIFFFLIFISVCTSIDCHEIEINSSLQSNFNEESIWSQNPINGDKIYKGSSSNQFLTEMSAEESLNNTIPIPRSSPGKKMILSESLEFPQMQQQFHQHQHQQQVMPLNHHPWKFGYLDSKKYMLFNNTTNDNNDQFFSGKYSTRDHRNLKKPMNNMDKIRNAKKQKNNNLKIDFFQIDVDEKHLLRLVLDGLNLKTTPNMEKVNISQQEYASMYREYINRMKYKHNLDKSQNENTNDEKAEPLTFHSINTYITDVYYVRRKRDLKQRLLMDVNKNHSRHNSNFKTSVLLKFSIRRDILKLNNSQEIDEANVRLMLLHSRRSSNIFKKTTTNGGGTASITSFKSPCGNKRNGTEKQKTHKNEKSRGRNLLKLKMFQILKNNKRKWVDDQKVLISANSKQNEESHSQWVQFDATKAVSSWLQESYHQDLILEIQCDNCLKVGVKILTESLSFSTNLNANTNSNNEHERSLELLPVLNIITRFGYGSDETLTHRHFLSHNISESSDIFKTHNDDDYQIKSYCNNSNKRCCRHFMQVVFKNIKGFEFIIQPKVFDAGYCQGRCPPRYNPANHHAVLQSLIWKQDHRRAPRPCCAPSKLREMEVLHVDEKDTAKLKISTWSDLIVLECACS